MRWRALYISLSKGRGLLRLLLGGMTQVLPAFWRGSMTRWSASKALSASRVFGFHVRQQRVCALQVMGLARGQEEAEWIAESVDQGMDLGAQSAFAAPDRLILAVFFWAPALC